MTARPILPCLLALLSLCAAGQTRMIDSLKKLARSETDPQRKLEAAIAVCEQRQSFHTDTLASYAQMAKALAFKTGNRSMMVLADYYFSNYLTKTEQFDSALRITNANLSHLSYDTNKDVYLKFAVQKGQIFIKSQRYKEALQQFYKLLDETEKDGNAVAQVNVKTNIGWVDMEIGQNKEALKWFYDALQSARVPGMNDYLGVVYSNMAASYDELEKYDSAEAYIRKAISVNRKNGKNLSFLANALAIQADIFTDTQRSSLAETSLNEALKIRQQIGEPFYIVSDMTQLGILYANDKEALKGIDICKQGIEMATKFRLSAKLPILYDALARNYKAGGMYKEYAATLEQLMSLRDSVYQKNSPEVLAEIQAKYDLQKKENTIIQQKLDLTKTNYLFYGLLLVTVFAMVAVFSLFRSRSRKHQLILEEEKRQTVHAVSRAEENERKRISADLHDNLGVYAASIAANIDHIVLSESTPDTQLALEELRNNSQSIVSQLSDTIWALKKDALSLTAVSDRLKVFVRKLQSSYPRIEMEIMEEIKTDTLLPPSQAFHLFQIVKEGINNALRHSGCTEVLVLIESYEKWKICIVDDGTGIRANRNSDGDGLVNMKNRTHEAGWNIEWRPNQPRGTCVVIEPASSI